MSDAEQSESMLLGDIIATLKTVIADHGKNKISAQTKVWWLREALGHAEQLYDQASRGVHRNPPLVIFGNPHGERALHGVRGGLMSTDVMAILYRHAQDGEFYCHGFGNADIDLSGSPLHGVTIDGLKEETGVRMYGTPSGSITIAHPSKRLWENFE